MERLWFVIRKKRKHGPVSHAQLQKLASAGKLRPQDVVIQEGATAGVSAGSIPGLFPEEAPRAVPTTPAEPELTSRRTVEPAAAGLVAAPSVVSAKLPPGLRNRMVALGAGIACLMLAVFVVTYKSFAAKDRKFGSATSVAMDGTDEADTPGRAQEAPAIVPRTAAGVDEKQLDEYSTLDSADLQKRFGDLKQRAEAGDVKSIYEVGHCYLQGIGVARDWTKATQWFQRGADKGDPVSAHSLGVCYATGRGVTPDKTKAVDLFQRSANAGYAKAMHDLGVCYKQGFGVAANQTLGDQWLSKAAKAGFSPPQPAQPDLKAIQKGLANWLAQEWNREWTQEDSDDMHARDEREANERRRIDEMNAQQRQREFNDRANGNR
jgi:hypothetical protein